MPKLELSLKQRLSWNENAKVWTRAVRDGAIASRVAATDAAMIGAVKHLAPATLVDLGCGEGWLLRRLTAELGCTGIGLDGCAELVAAARRADPANRYDTVAYDDIAQARLAQARLAQGRFVLDPGTIDAVLCNFSLLDEDLEPLLTALGHWLTPDGRLIIQTLHPSALDEKGEADGWHTETFDAFADPASGNDTWTPMPYYFRTLETWERDLARAGFRILRTQEPAHPDTGRFLSLLITCARDHATNQDRHAGK